jgi:phage-related tail fiber protein
MSNATVTISLETYTNLVNAETKFENIIKEIKEENKHISLLLANFAYKVSDTNSKLLLEILDGQKMDLEINTEMGTWRSVALREPMQLPIGHKLITYNTIAYANR